MLLSSALRVGPPPPPARQAILPFPRRVPPRHTKQTGRLDLFHFIHLLDEEGLADRVPFLEDSIAALAHYHRSVFGFGFRPSDLRIPLRDVPWILLGIRDGILTRPVVLDSPSLMDVVELGLDTAQSILHLRIERLAASGMQFLGSDVAWDGLRSARHGALADRLARSLQRGRSAWWSDFQDVYEHLPDGPTVGERVGTAPRLLFVGAPEGPRPGRLLAVRESSEPCARTVAPWQSAALTLEAGCRFLGPEAALLLAGCPDVREGDSSLLGGGQPVLLAALTPSARVATMQAEAHGVRLGCRDARGCDIGDRFIAAHE